MTLIEFGSWLAIIFIGIPIAWIIVGNFWLFAIWSWLDPLLEKIFGDRRGHKKWPIDSDDY